MINAEYAEQPAADGQRFLVNTLLGSGDRSPITLAVNWTQLLTHRER